MGLDVFRGVRRRFEFFPQRHHKDPEGSNIVVPASSPDILRDIGMRQDFSGISGKKAEQPELDGRELQLFSVQKSASGGEIDLQISVLEGDLGLQAFRHGITYGKLLSGADRKIRELMAERRAIFNQVTELTNRIKQSQREH